MKHSEMQPIEAETDIVYQKGLMSVLEDTAQISSASSNLDILKIRKHEELIDKMESDGLDADSLISYFKDCLEICRSKRDGKSMALALKLITDIKYKTKADPNTIAKNLNINNNLKIDKQGIYEYEVERELASRGLK